MAGLSRQGGSFAQLGMCALVLVATGWMNGAAAQGDEPAAPGGAVHDVP